MRCVKMRAADAVSLQPHAVPSSRRHRPQSLSCWGTREASSGAPRGFCRLRTASEPQGCSAAPTQRKLVLWGGVVNEPVPWPEARVCPFG